MSTPLGDSSHDERPRRDDSIGPDDIVGGQHGHRGGGVPVHEPQTEQTQEFYVPERTVRTQQQQTQPIAGAATFEEGHRRFGGIKWGSAFFGWLTATGAVVLLLGGVAAIGAVLDQNTSADLEQISQDPQSAGVVGGVTLGLVLFVGYFCGGYVAGRMSRFDGARQGVAVWIWALVMVAAFTALGFLFGSRFDMPSDVSGLPSLPVQGSDRTIAAWVVAASAVVVALAAAALGGRVGMHFHRKVDAASGLGSPPNVG